MTYEELLKRPEWHSKCIQIMKRDNHRCTKCGTLGFHSQSYYECEDLQGLGKVFPDSVTINKSSLVDFLQQEFNSTDGYIEGNAKVSSCDKQENSSYQSRIENDAEECAEQLLTYGYMISDEGIFLDEVKNDEKIHAFYKAYRRGISKEMKGYDNSIIINLGNNFSNKIEIASSFKLDKVLTNKCILSIWQEPMTGGFWNGWGVDYYSSIVISITYRNYCFTIQMLPCDHSDPNNPIITPGLNIHHQYYIKGKNPWEYEDEALITLCENCHKKFHRTHPTPVYRNVKVASAFIGNANICNRCGGSGYLPQYDYYLNGVCFGCWGEGVILP